jgi:dihydrofolate reductase
MEKSNTVDKLSIIAAIGRNRALGKDGKLLWSIPDDLKRFKELTVGHAVVMGRKTWESLPEKVRPLPGRVNIVITRQAGYEAPGAIIARSFEEALRVAGDGAFIIGGAEIYALALPHTSRLYLTLIDDEKEGDIYFPAYEKEFTKIISDETHEWDGLTYRWLTLERP